MKSATSGLRYFSRLAVIITIAVLGFSLPGYGDNYSLISEQPVNAPLSAQMAGLPAGFPPALQSRAVVLNPVITSSNVLVPGDVITLNLFADIALTANVDRVSKNVNGTVTVRGRIKDYPLGYLIISTTNNNILASIDIPETGERYRIQMDTHTGVHYLLEEDTDLLEKLEDSPSPIPPTPQKNAAEMEKLADNTANGPLDPVTLDVMIVYTPAARDWANSSGGGIANVISQAVAKGQLAMDNSNTIVTLNLVYSGEISYTESGDSGTDLTRLTYTSDGYMDSVHTLRNTYHADVVGLFTRIEDTGGIGWLLSSTSGNPEYAFSISRVQQAGWTYTYVHEMGHNMGCHHRKDQATQPGPGLFSYSAGWHWIGNNSGLYCSVMSYEDGGYTTVAHFSNPNITYQGVATGDAADGDNARTLREIKGVIAAYRIGTYTLSVNSSGATSVSISSSTGHGGTTNYMRTVSSGTSVTLTAPLYVDSCASRKRFDGWTGSAPSGSQSITFTMDGNKTVTANYVADPEIFTLTVDSSGASDVTIDSSTGHEGITNYTKTVTCGTSVTLTAPSTTGGNIFAGWTGDVTTGSQAISFAMNGDMHVTANFVSITPVLHPEPNITSGLCNLISWGAASGADAFYAECSSDPCFLVVDYSSNWITRTSYQFCDLSACQEYWYRVKSGASVWSQTSQAEFQSDTLTDTTTTSGGDVTLFAGGTDVVGGTEINSDTENDSYFNGFLVTTETPLTQIEVYLGISTSRSIEFVVYEGDITFFSQYNRIHSSTLASSGTGTKFYSSGPISVTLHAGRYYMIGAVCDGSVTIYYDTTASSPIFADHAGWGYYLDFPSADILPTANISEDPITLYHRYTTAQGAGYASSGSVVSTPINLPAGGNWGIADFNTTTPPNTELTVDILPSIGSTPITGYEDVPIGADLGGISETTIRLRADLYTSDSNSTPALHDWSVTYSDPAGIESGWSNIESSIQVIPGDFEPDCDVDWNDFAILANQWLQPPGTPSADIAPLPEGDGVVNYLDLAEFATHWLEEI